MHPEQKILCLEKKQYPKDDASRSKRTLAGRGFDRGDGGYELQGCGTRQRQEHGWERGRKREQLLTGKKATGERHRRGCVCVWLPCKLHLLISCLVGWLRSSSCAHQCLW
jgi:hypothetical protein